MIRLGWIRVISIVFLAVSMLGCNSNSTDPDSEVTLGEIPANPFKAPLYWSVYEYHITRPDDLENYITEDAFVANINWVEENLKPYGYTMVAIDGWGDVSKFNEYGYRTTHSKNWQNDYAWWANELQKRGLNLGMYDNPLWVNLAAVDAGARIKGTNIPLSNIIDREEETLWFTWVQVQNAGAEEYVKGYVEHYAQMGIKYLRVDFISWFEDGFDKNLGNVGPKRTREEYITALKWIREACDAHGIFFSLVMPALKEEALVEQRFAHMIRINEDVGDGGWFRFSEMDRGIRRDYWSQYANTFDGYIYWSGISGKEKMILDGDFIRINTLANDDEKKSVISLHIMAGGPLSPADQYNTIGENLWLYQNEELLQLNKDGFVGKPLSNDPTDVNSQIWWGQLSNGEIVFALFNREDTPQTRSVNFTTDFGISGEYQTRDLWSHENLEIANSFSDVIPPHGVRVIKLSNN